MADLKVAFNARNGITVGSTPIALCDSSGNVTAVALTASGTTNLQTTNVNAALDVKSSAVFSTAFPTCLATTPAVSDSSTKLITSAWVRSLAAGAGQLPVQPAATADQGTSNYFARADHVHPIDLSLYAPKANATFTGTTSAAALNVSGATALGTLTSTDISIATGNSFKINGVSILSATTLASSVVNSSLTSVGTIATGVWHGSPVPVAYGGTGAAITEGVNGALDNILPAGETLGYVLKTSGPGTYYWAAETGGSPTIGTKIDTQRYTETIVGSAKTIFNIGITYTPGAGQVRVYINGVRQHPSKVTESTATQVVLAAPGAQVDDDVLIEVDGYTAYTTPASSISTTAIGSIGASNVQTVLETLNTNKAEKNQTMYLGTTAVAINRTSLTGHNIDGVVINGVTPTALTTGFSISGGTTGRTLTVPITGTLGTAAYTDSSAYLPANGTAVAASAFAPNTGYALGGTTTAAYIRMDTGGVVRGYMYADSVGVGFLNNVGNWTAYVPYGTSNWYCAGNITGGSDENFKTNWTPLKPNFIDELAKVKHGVYDRTDCVLRQVGVGAQSLQTVLPEAVETGPDGKLSVAYGHAALAACVEMAAEIVKLRAEIQALKGGV